MRTWAGLAVLALGCGSGHGEARVTEDGGPPREHDSGARPAMPIEAAAPAVADSGPPLSVSYSNPIDPGVERVLCLDVAGPDAETWIRGWHVQREAVHHVNLYVRGTGSPLAKPTACGIDPGQHRLMFDASQPDLSYQLPGGTAFRVPGGASWLLEVHELNATDAPSTATVSVSLDRSDPAQDVNGLVLYIPTLAVPAGATTTISGSCKAPADMRLIGLTSHSHAHDVAVTATLGGASVYSSTNWAEPAIVPRTDAVHAGDVLRWSCKIQNDLTTTINNCIHRDTCEMCEVLGWAVTDKTWSCGSNAQ